MTTPDEPIDPNSPSPAPEWYEGDTEHTRPLPYVEAAPEGAARPFFSRRAGIAAIVAAALLGGAAAGVGGATWADAWSDDGASTVAISPNTSTGTSTGGSASAIEQVAAKVLPSVVQINVSGQGQSGSGSGIVLSADGMILTNNHVVVVAGQGGTISVSMNNGKVYPAKLIGTDPVTDSAVIQAQGISGLTPATLGHSNNLKVGQSVLAIGAPYGLSSTVTQGIISALNRPVQVNEG
ncbi:MAG: S1C family serine protease, partial [Marmoricola sp.]